MFGKRCTLCGGRLDSNQICKECGLDNRKSEKNYQINRSGCEDLPLTHVHTERNTGQNRQYHSSRSQQDRSQYRQAQAGGQEPQRQRRKYQGYQRQIDPPRKRRKGCLIWIVILVIVITVLAAVIPFLGQVRNDADTEWVSQSIEEQGPYEYVTSALSNEGTAVEYELPSGRYIVGVHIPSGRYVAEPVDDFDVVRVWDEENSISLYEYKGKEGENYLDDLRLYPGAVVEISAESPIKLTSDNAQAVIMAGMENPLTESVELTGGDIYEAGADLPPGSYDVIVTGGEGDMDITVLDEGGQIYDEKFLNLGTDSGTDGSEYRNLILPEGSRILCEKSLKVTLVPSRTIRSTDYFEEYRASY